MAVLCALLESSPVRGVCRGIRETLLVQPERPGRVQGQRLARSVVSVLLCDVVQLLLVDVNVGGNGLSAQGVSVHLEVRLPRRNRHFGRPDSDFCCSCVNVPNKNSRFCFIASYRNTAAFRLPTGDVSTLEAQTSLQREDQNKDISLLQFNRYQNVLVPVSGYRFPRPFQIHQTVIRCPLQCRFHNYCVFYIYASRLKFYVYILSIFVGAYVTVPCVCY